MQRIAFTMKLFKGCKEEYKKRHDELWDDMRLLLKEKGVSDFSIFLDEDSSMLFAFLVAEDPSALMDLPDHPVQKKWWKYMKDIMQTNADNSPFTIDLKEVFYLP